MIHYAHDVYAHFARWMSHLRRQPLFLAISIVQPFFWLFLFSQAMSRALGAGGPRYAGLHDYPAFMTGSVIVMTVFNNSLMAGIPILFDREFGVLNRILATPSARSAILVGRFLAVSLVTMIQVVIVLASAGAFLDVDIASGAFGLVAIFGLVLLFGLGISLVSMTLAFTFRSHVEFFAMLSVVSLPLVFLSSALVPLEAMPTWLAWLARLNPMTYAIDGVRHLIQVGWSRTIVLRMAAALMAFAGLMFVIALATTRRKLVR